MVGTLTYSISYWDPSFIYMHITILFLNIKCCNDILHINTLIISLKYLMVGRCTYILLGPLLHLHAHTNFIFDNSIYNDILMINSFIMYYRNMSYLYKPVVFSQVIPHVPIMFITFSRNNLPFVLSTNGRKRVIKADDTSALKSLPATCT